MACTAPFYAADALSHCFARVEELVLHRTQGPLIEHGGFYQKLFVVLLDWNWPSVLVPQCKET